MTDCASFTPLSHEGILAVRGPDAKTFLQGQITCHLGYVSDERSSLGARCTPKGRMLSSFRVLLENDGILPLKENAQKILITGFNADNKLAYLGNYFGDPSHFVMVTEAISQYNIDTELARAISV